MPKPIALAPLHPAVRGHLDVLTDGVGIMQHARDAEPDPAHGYCVDDVARALQVDMLHARELGWNRVATRAWRNLRFLSDAFDDLTGRFRNFRSVDLTWADGRPSEDSQGRAMLALGEVIATAPDERMVAAAAALFADALPRAQRVSALRARSSVLLGCDAALRGAPTPETEAAFLSLAARLRSTFGADADADWPWPEPLLTYENALPVRALIVAGQRVGSRSMVDRGLALLDWLVVAQTDKRGNLSPIGNGWWAHDGEKSHFDQQPIEATALLLAAETAYERTGDTRYRDAMERAYAWFLGRNDLGVEIADPVRGAGRDGLTPTGANTNEGAESTLMWLMALEHIRALRGREEDRDATAATERPLEAAGAGAMTGAHDGGLFQRFADNPILTAHDVPYPCNTIFNPGAAQVDGETVLLARVEDLRGISQLHVVRSPDGLTGWTFDPEPLLVSDVEHHPEEIWGCEDPRVTWLAERKEWAITYTAYSGRGPLVSLATTKDFRTVTRLGPVMPPEDKDAAMFPRRFDGRWAMTDRPSPLRGNAHMWVSYSPDLRHWGDHTLLLEARDGAWWDAGKIGLGPPPIECSEGWLVMYHGVHHTGDGPIYRTGLALMDLEDPSRVLHRTDEWVFGPSAPYELTGDVSRVVFPCGWIHDEDNDRLLLYYGAADSAVAVATATFSEVLARVCEAPGPE